MLSVILVSFNTREHLRACLRSLYQYQVRDYEVIVVDNASWDGSAAMVAAEFPKTRLLRNSVNEGFAAGANAGLRAANGDVAVLLNPDSVLTHDAFSAPTAFMRSHADVGAVGLKILNPDGTLQLSVRRFPNLWAALFNRYSMLTRWWPNNPYSRRYLMSDWAHDRLSDVDWVSGACFMTSRAALDRVGYLDSGYFWGFEDVDFCQRLHRAGLRVVYFPDSSVIHAIGVSARSVPAKALIARHRGMWRYYRSYLRSWPPVDAAVFAGIWLRCASLLAASAIKRLAARVLTARPASAHAASQ
jgi:GT2 family glycosyltransferase